MAFTYNAVITRWADADTVHMTVDVGFGADIHMKFALYGVDIAEPGRPGHDEAAARAVEVVPVGSIVQIHTYKSADRYGRYLVVIDTDTGTLNQQLINEGHAVPYYGGSKAIHP